MQTTTKRWPSLLVMACCLNNSPTSHHSCPLALKGAAPIVMQYSVRARLWCQRKRHSVLYQHSLCWIALYSRYGCEGFCPLCCLEHRLAEWLRNSARPLSPMKGTAAEFLDSVLCLGETTVRKPSSRQQTPLPRRKNVLPNYRFLCRGVKYVLFQITHVLAACTRIFSFAQKNYQNLAKNLTF